MASSGAFTQTLNFAQVTERAWARCLGIDKLGAITQEMAQSARDNAFILMSDWVNRGIKLWTVQRYIQQLVPGQAYFTLPAGAIDITGNDATIRYSTYPSGGTAYSSAGGVAANAFAQTQNNPCTQTAPNGRIYYDFGAGNTPEVTTVGICSYVNATYTLVFEASADGATWTTVLSNPATAYVVGQWQWFDVPNSLSLEWFSVRETGGATLNLTGVAFNTNVTETTIGRITRDAWSALPTKYQQGIPSQFWVDRQITPQVYVWPLVGNYTNQLAYYAFGYCQDPGSAQLTPNVPNRWVAALISGLAERLSYEAVSDPTRIPLLAQLAARDYEIAASEERERGPLNMAIDLTGYYR